MHVTYGACVVVARACYVFGMVVKPQARIDCYSERLQLGYDLQPAAGDLDRSDSGSRSELSLRCCSKDEGLRLVCVELQIIPQEPRADRTTKLELPYTEDLVISSSTSCSRGRNDEVV